MKKYSILIFFTFACYCLNAQEKYESPEVITYRISRSDRKKGIRYCFPYNVSLLIDSALSRRLRNYPKFDYLLELNIIGDTIEVYAYSLNNALKSLPKNDPVRLVSEISHRYTVVRDKIIPIYFTTDAILGVTNFSFTGYHLYIKFSGRKFEEGEIFEYDIR